MRSNSNDGYRGNPLLALDFIGAVVPENSMGARSVVLGIGFKDLFTNRTGKRCELVRLKTWVVRVFLQVANSFPNLLEKCGF
jgi:hypothetical protein